MGIFGFIKKGIGKVAKAGLSVVTRGLSDKVLTTAKSLGLNKQRTQKAKGGVMTEQMKAATAKVNLKPTMAKPATQREFVLPVRGQSITPYRPENYRDTRSKKDKEYSTVGYKKPKKRKKKASADPYRSKKREPKRKSAGGGRRGPPKGGRDLKAIGVKYRASGRTDWKQFVKENSSIRKG